MSLYPEIKNQKYHDMSFDEVDKIRESIKSGEKAISIKETELMLYLNQMKKKHSFVIKWVQNISILTIIGSVIFIFIKWKISPPLFVTGIIAHIVSRKLARKYIFEECKEDSVFLKFALGVGLVKIRTK